MISDAMRAHADSYAEGNPNVSVDEIDDAYWRAVELATDRLGMNPSEAIERSFVKARIDRLVAGREYTFPLGEDQRGEVVHLCVKHDPHGRAFAAEYLLDSEIRQRADALVAGAEALLQGRNQ